MTRVLLCLIMSASKRIILGSKKQWDKLRPDRFVMGFFELRLVQRISIALWVSLEWGRPNELIFLFDVTALAICSVEFPSALMAKCAKFGCFLMAWAKFIITVLSVEKGLQETLHRFYSTHSYWESSDLSMSINFEANSLVSSLLDKLIRLSFLKISNSSVYYLPSSGM